MMTAVMAIAGRSISAGAAGRLPAPAVERGGLAWKLVSGVLLLAMIVGNDATRKPALFCEGGRCAIATPGAGHHSIASLIPLTTGAAKEAVRTSEMNPPVARHPPLGPASTMPPTSGSSAWAGKDGGNGGLAEPWHDLKAPPACYRDVSIVDMDVMFASGETGVVVKTVDGGTSWKNMLVGGTDYYWYGVHAFDADNVIIVGFQDTAAKTTGIMRTSSDGGEHWSNDTVIDSGAWITGTVQFADPVHGFTLAALAGRGHATSDAGKTWRAVKVEPAGWCAGQFVFNQPGDALRLSGISFCENVGTVANFSFECKPSVDPDGDGQVFFTDAAHGWVAGGLISPQVAGWLHSTEDGGKSWTPRIHQGPWPIRALMFSDDGATGFATGGNFFTGVGGIYVTTDAGKTWTVDQSTGAEQTVVRAVPPPSSPSPESPVGSRVAITAGCARSGGKIFARAF